MGTQLLRSENEFCGGFGLIEILFTSWLLNVVVVDLKVPNMQKLRL